jgi:hypothetical protein
MDTETQIIEAAALMLRLYHLDEGDELEQTNRALQAALSRLPAENHCAAFMVFKLLDGKPIAITTKNPANIQLCIAMAHKIGATVEENDGGASADLPGTRTIRAYPPSQSPQ